MNSNVLFTAITEPADSPYADTDFQTEFEKRKDDLEQLENLEHDLNELLKNLQEKDRYLDKYGKPSFMDNMKYKKAKKKDPSLQSPDEVYASKKDFIRKKSNELWLIQKPLENRIRELQKQSMKKVFRTQ